MKKRLMISFIIVLQLLLAGCWDQGDIRDFAIVESLGIDIVTKDGIPQWQISALVINPSVQGDKSRSKSTSKNGGNEDGVSPEILWKGYGDSFQEAFNNLISRSPRTPFLSHLKVLIIGEKAAKEKILDITETIESHRAGRPTMYILFSKGEAYSVLQTEPEAASNLSRELSDLVDKTVERTGYSVEKLFGEFAKELFVPERDPTGPQVIIIYPEETKGTKAAGPQKSVLVEGLAVFRNTDLTGWLNKQEALGYLLITRKISTGDIPINFRVDNQTMVYTLIRSACKIKSELTDDKLKISLEVNTAGNIYETEPKNLSTSDIPKLESLISDRIREIILSTIKRAGELDSDCLGFGERLYRTNPQGWKAIQPDWREKVFAAPIEINVNCKINNFGRTITPFSGE